MNDSDRMIVKVTKDTDPFSFILFKWDEDMCECDMVAAGDWTEEEIDALVSAKAHEGVDVPGHSVTLS